MSTSLPPAVLRKALTDVFGSGPVSKHDDGMRRVAEKIEEAGYLVVARADVHALRAAADKVCASRQGSTRWRSGAASRAARSTASASMATRAAARRRLR